MSYHECLLFDSRLPICPELNYSATSVESAVVTCLSLEDHLCAPLGATDSRLVELLPQEELVARSSLKGRESWLSLVALQPSWKLL